MSQHCRFTLLLLHIWHTRASTSVRLIPCQVTWARRTLALWLGEWLPIELLTIERLHNVTRQFFCRASSARFLFVLSAGRAFLPRHLAFPPSFFFSFLGRSRDFIPLHFIFYLRQPVTYVTMTKREREKSSSVNRRTHRIHARGPFRSFQKTRSFQSEKKKPRNSAVSYHKYIISAIFLEAKEQLERWASKLSRTL